MKRPLAIVSLIYAAGILAGRFLPLPLTPLFIVAIILGAVVSVDRFRTPLLLAALLFLSGWTNIVSRTAVLSPADLRLVAGSEPQIVRLRGELAESPSLRRSGESEPTRVKTLGVMAVSAIQCKNEWQPAFGKVALSTDGELPRSFWRTRQVEVLGVIRPPGHALAPGLFDYANYLRWKQIYHQLEVAGSNDWSLQTPASSQPWTERFTDWAQATMTRGLPREDASLRLLWAMALGWKTGLTDEIAEPFMQTGTMHIFAISGMHIALIAGILVSLLRVAQIPRGVCGWLVLPLLWCYTAATGWQPSAIRSTIMMSIVIGGWALKRPGDLLNSLAASAFVILLWQPQQLFQASFQLSFFVVLSLALLTPPLQHQTERLLAIDPFLPPELQPRWKQRMERAARYLLLSAATSLAAWIGSLPLVAYYFHLMTPVSLVANLLVVPLSGLALMCNLGSLLCGEWLPGLTVLFNHSAWLWMELMVRLSIWAAQWPGAFLYVRSPSFLEFALYYAILVCATGKGLFSPTARAGLAISIALLSLCWLVGVYRDRALVELAILPAQGGDAIYFQEAGEIRGLIDGGSERWADFATKPFLHAQGVNRLDFLLLTHGDAQHVGGYFTLKKTFSPKEIVTSETRFRSPSYRRISEDLAASPKNWRKVSAGDQVGPWTVLHPGPAPLARSADDQALVLQAKIHQCRILLLSDLGLPGQRRLLEQRANLQSDLVVVGVPREGEPLIDALVEAAAPRLIIVNNTGLPLSAKRSPPWQARLARHNIPLIFVQERGAVTVNLQPGRWEARTMTGDVISFKSSAR